MVSNRGPSAYQPTAPSSSCLMSSDAKSILGTIYKVSLSWIYHSSNQRGEGGDGERSKLGPPVDQYLDRDMRSLEQRGNEG